MKKLPLQAQIPTIYLLTAVAAALVAIITVAAVRNYSKPANRIPAFNNTLNKQYSIALQLAGSLPEPDSTFHFEKLSSFNESLPEAFSLYAFRNNEMVYWSNNDFALNQIDPDALVKNRIVRTTGGYYQIVHRRAGEFTLIIANLIRHEYPYRNDYLKSGFAGPYLLPDGWTITFSETAYPITSQNGEILFFINASPPTGLPASVATPVFLLYLISFVFLILSLFAIYKNLQSKHPLPLMLFLFLADILVLRGILQYFRIPAILDQTELFNAVHYASSAVFPSLGDLTITIAGLTVFAVLFFREFDLVYNSPDKDKPGQHSAASRLFLLLFAVLLYFVTCYIIESLQVNSTLQMDFGKIIEFSAFSILGFLIIFLVLLNFFLISFPIFKNVYRQRGYRYVLLHTGGLLLLIWTIACVTGWYKPGWGSLVLFFVYLILILRMAGDRLRFPGITALTLLVITLTSVSSYNYYRNNRIRENNQRKLLAVKLSNDRDKVAEYLYPGLEAEIASDTLLPQMIRNAWMDPSLETECSDYILESYLKGFWSKYNAQITLCFPGKTLRIKPGDYVIGCEPYFDNIIVSLGEKAGEGNLYYIRETWDEGNYIARIPIHLNGNNPLNATVVIELIRKYAPKGLGYPELLLNKPETTSDEWSEYSYAIYSNNELVKSAGDYSYSIYESAYTSEKLEFYFFDRNGYNHLFHAIDNNSSIIISRKNEGLLNTIAPFTYQTTFHALMVLLIAGAAGLFKPGKKMRLDLSTRLQFTFIALVLFASTLIGFTVLNNIRNLNSLKNRDMLSEKAHSVLIELEHKLATRSQLDPTEQAYFEELLVKFSQVFFSDINLYNVQGNLLASSRQQIFDEGLKSLQMNAEAFRQLSVNKRTLYIMNEHIGSYNYLSAYIPFRNHQNKLIAYINLPYFARQQELKEEISAFLVAFINIYVILTFLAIVISLLAGSYLTKPLQLIRERLTSLNLGNRNEKIEYNRRDELGELINEYNLMIEKLSESAEKLARSERESAWREMARQVAHEIKNPLTPMKLSIQHLKKSWEEQAPDWDKRFVRTSNTLIQQIDSLSAIASAFSDFAKLPQANNKKTELLEIIRNTLGLFTEHPNTDIVLELTEGPCYVFADEKQLSRVFINLINNSLQAIPQDRRGIIAIKVETKGKYHNISIRDNGSGISEEQKSRIFSPNFTTKSGGTGLGLAMVKNIINSAGGEIGFISEDRKGTTFIIDLPAVMPS